MKLGCDKRLGWGIEASLPRKRPAPGSVFPFPRQAGNTAKAPSGASFWAPRRRPLPFVSSRWDSKGADGFRPATGLQLGHDDQRRRSPSVPPMATPKTGHVQLRALTSERIHAFQAELLAEGVGAETTRRTMAMLQGMLERATEWGRIPRNPARSVRKPRQAVTRGVHPCPAGGGAAEAALTRASEHPRRDACLRAGIRRPQAG